MKKLNYLAAVGFTFACLSPALASEDIEIPEVESFEVQPVGFWEHSQSCDGCDFNAAACDGCGCPLEGLIKPSDHCFDDFISPMINFVFFEDPRTLTEVRPIFVNHWVPNTLQGGVPAGGSIQLLALHLRVALSERLSIIATKDGYIFDGTSGALAGLLNSGAADVSAGLKYNFLRDIETGTLGSAGFTYEIPMGSRGAQQAVGDGEFYFFASLGKRLLEGDAHFLSTVGYRAPVDANLQSTSIHWSNHIDYRVTEKSYLFTELAWWHWTDSANQGLPLAVAGQDLFNLSTTGVAGNDLVTQSVGVKVKPNSKTEVGLAYEFPLTDFKDVIASRLMVDLIFRY